MRNAAIGLSQLEGALRNQVLYGGRLGKRDGLLELLGGEGASAQLVQDPGTVDARGVVEKLPELVVGHASSSVERFRFASVKSAPTPLAPVSPAP